MNCDQQLSRRELLQMSAAIAVTSVIPTTVSGQTNHKETAEGCTLGFSTYGMKTLTTERAIEVLAEIGYDAFEITVFSGWDADPTVMNSSRRKRLSTKLRDSGLKLTSLMEHVTPTSDEQQANAIERLKHACELAHDLAPETPPLVQTVLGGGSFEKSKVKLVDRLGKWVEIADEHATTIAIKPHRGGIVSKPDEAVWLFEQLKRPQRLRMVYDYSHYAYREMTLENTISTALPWTAHIAVKDAVKDGGRVTFGLPGVSKGVDFSKLIQQFYKGGYRGDVSCEVSSMVWKQGNYDAIKAAEICYKNISEAFRQSGVPRSSVGKK